VMKYGAQELIRKNLREKNYEEGKDFIFLA
jgi:hypothetical protein